MISTEFLDRKPAQTVRRPAPARGDGTGHRARDRRCSAWTSRCRISTPSCACRPVLRSPLCKGVWGTTTVYVTHDQVEAMTMGDRVAVLRFGKRGNSSPRPTSCTTGPANAFVAGFIGSPAMNLVTLPVASDGVQDR